MTKNRYVIKLIVFFIGVLFFIPPVYCNYAQTAKIFLSAKNQTIESVFKDIEKQTEFVFFYYDGLLNANQRISINVKDLDIETVLAQILKNSGVSYTIDDRQIILRKNSESSVPAPSVQQSKDDLTITGTVKDEAGEPLPGVNIIVLGGTRGVATDLDGTFTISVKKTDKLVFSYLGMEDQTIAVSGKKTLNVIMKEKTDELEEVTIVAFGKQKKESLIGSISTVKPAELKVPSSNLTTALAGRVAGMISYQRSGEPGLDNADFFIRGVTTFGYKVDPLILVDNMEVTTTDLARLNVDDIASFSIMKDATATALYGARGANGVILITTKQGSEGKAKLNIRYETRLSTPTRNVELADPITYMKLHNEAVLTRNPLGMQPYTQDKIAKTAAGVDPYLYPATNWKDELMKNYAINHRVNLNISGGGKVARYYVAGNLSQDNGNLKVPKMNDFNNNIKLKTSALRANVNINVTKTTELIARVAGTFDDYSGPLAGGTDVYNSIMHTNPVLFPPYYQPGENEKHVKHILFGNYGEGNYINPYADMVKGYKNYSRSNMYAQFELKQDLKFITEGLSFRGLLNTTRNSYFDVTRKYNPFYYQATGIDEITGDYQLELLNEEKGTEYLDYTEGKKTVSSIFYLEAALNYSHTFADKHDVGGLLVYTMRDQLNGNAGSLNESLAARNIGFSGRATYGYDKRYMVEFNFGYNGSERFSKNHRFGFFPSAGLAWTISNESFFEPLRDKITNLKLRGSYGLVGNDAIGSSSERFFYLSEMNMNDSNRGATFGVDNAYGKNGISISNYSNTDITWEVSYKTNLALELELFKKLNVVAEVFNDKRTNILMSRSFIPTTMGLSAPIKANVGEAKGNGVDLSMDYSHVINKDLWLQARGNFTYATSEYVIYEEPDYNEKYLSKVGYSLGQQWGYIADRLFLDDEEVRNSPVQNFGEYGGGDIKYHDTNGDGKITELDKVPIGYPTTPEIIYGFGASMGWKDFDFSFFFQGSARSSFWIDAEKTAPFQGETQLLKVYADNHWSEENRNIYALWPRLSPTINKNNSQQSTWFMQDGSFLRLKQVEIGYTLPRHLSHKMHLGNLRFYLSGSNLLTFSKFKLWDVEMAGNGLGYPIQMNLCAGVNLSF